jgi:enoyl reductase-like protein
MTQDEIIEMAKQTQMPFYWRTGEITYLDKLERFAAYAACSGDSEWQKKVIAAKDKAKGKL